MIYTCRSYLTRLLSLEALRNVYDEKQFIYWIRVPRYQRHFLILKPICFN